MNISINMRGEATKYALTLASVAALVCTTFGAEPTYVLSNGVVSMASGSVTTASVSTPPCYVDSFGRTVCPTSSVATLSVPTKITVPPGFHAHQTASGTIVHADSNYGSAEAHVGVLGTNWPKTAYPGQTVTASSTGFGPTTPVFAQSCPTGNCPSASFGVSRLPALPPPVLTANTLVGGPLFTATPVRSFLAKRPMRTFFARLFGGCQ